MELQQKYLEETELLKAIVGKHLDVNVMSKNRKRIVVDGRLIYSKILKEQGHTLSYIGRTLGRDHSTVLYYINTFDNIVTLTPNLRNNYLKCKYSFTSGNDMDYTELRLQIEELKSQVNELIAENNRLREI